MNLLKWLTENQVKTLLNVYTPETLKKSLYKDIIDTVKKEIVKEYNEAPDKVGFLKYWMFRTYVSILKEEFNKQTGRDYYIEEYQKIFHFDDFIL